MRHSIVAALMAATALIPGTAFAQRDGSDGFTDRGAARQQRQEARLQQKAPDPVSVAPQPRFDRSERADAGQFRGGGGLRADAGVPAEARGDRGDRFRGNRPDADRGDGAGRWNRGTDRGSLVAAAPIVRATPRADRGRDWQGNADRRPDRGRDWQGNADRRPDRGNWTGNANRGDARNGTWRNDGNRGGWNDGNRGGWNDGNRGGWNDGNRRNGNSWNRNWRQDNRYDWNRRRQYNRNAFHLPRYYAPSGWNYGYRRFGIGFTLSSLLFRQSYWIDDPYGYGLPEAYGPYRWVRYYNDALLVDIYSGEVVDTVYDIFW